MNAPRMSEDQRLPDPAATTARLAAVDQKCLWHPFTQMQAWCDPSDPPLIVDRGKGVWLWDRDGNRYIDGNSSI